MNYISYLYKYYQFFSTSSISGIKRRQAVPLISNGSIKWISSSKYPVNRRKYRQGWPGNRLRIPVQITDACSTTLPPDKLRTRLQNTCTLSPEHCSVQSACIGFPFCPKSVRPHQDCPRFTFSLCQLLCARFSFRCVRFNPPGLGFRVSRSFNTCFPSTRASARLHPRQPFETPVVL